MKKFIKDISKSDYAHSGFTDIKITCDEETATEIVLFVANLNKAIITETE
jgi:hypothetical protein